MKKVKQVKTLILALLIIAAIQGKTQTYTWESMEPMPTDRALCTSSVLNGKIYVIGGTVSDTSQAIGIVEVYDPMTNTWETRADLPVGLCSATSSVVNGKIYVVGGSTIYLGTKLQSVYEYDPGGNSWTSKQDLPSPRAWHAASVVDDKIYVTGGAEESLALDSVIMYDPSTNVWTTKENMLTPRAFLSSETVGSKIYTTGGIYLGIPRSTVEEYDPQNNTWTTMTSMPQAKLWHNSGVIDDQIYVFGGAASIPTFSPGTWKYDPATDIWSDMNTDMPIAIAAFASSVALDAGGEPSIYTFGGGLLDFWIGGSGTLVSDEVLKFSIVTSTQNPEEASPIVLFQNYPNPASSYTMIKYHLKNSGKVSIKIFDITGQEVAVPFEGFQQAGEHSIEWNTKGLSDGVYLYQLQSETFTESGRCIVNN